MRKSNQKALRFIRTICAVAVLVTMMAACGGSKDAKESMAPKIDLPTDVKGEVKVLTWAGGGETDKFKKLFADFNKEYPNIKATYMQQATGDLAALIAAGEAPDIVSSNGLAADLRKDNMIEDLTPYIGSSPEIQPGLYYQPAYERSVDGKGVWALPWQVDPNFALAYNNDVLEQYGFTEIPEMRSLQEFGDFLHKFWVTENGQQVMTTFAPHEVYGANNSLITMAYLNGADASSYYNPGENKVTYNNPKIVEALEWIVNFKRINVDDERMGKLNATLPENTGRLVAGKSLMEPHVTALLRGLLQAKPELKLAPMPDDSIWLGGWSFSLTTAGSKENKPAAWALLKWMTSTKAGAESAQKHFGWISGIKDNPYLQEEAKKDPIIGVAFEVLKKAKKMPPSLPVDNGKEFDAKWAEVMSGKLEPKAFLDHMTTFTQALLDEQAKKK